MALLFVICAVVFRLSLDWIEIQDRRAEQRRQQEREEKLNMEPVTIETRIEEFEMYIYEFGA